MDVGNPEKCRDDASPRYSVLRLPIMTRNIPFYGLSFFRQVNWTATSPE
jgi:hypothetical protein